MCVCVCVRAHVHTHAHTHTLAVGRAESSEWISQALPKNLNLLLKIMNFRKIFKPQ